MDPTEKTGVLLAALSVFSLLLVSTAEFIPEDCGDVQHGVENGMIRLPDFTGENIPELNCSWTYTAPSGRKLLVKVDGVHLPPLDHHRTSLLQLSVDDSIFDLPRDCVKCLREMVGGKVLNVVFTSYFSSSEYRPLNTSETGSEGIGSFQIRYKAFDPNRCGKPEQIENGFIVGRGKKLGQSVFYHCNPPYDLVGQSELRCIISPDSPVPEWSDKPPKCVVQECTGEPVIKEGSSGAIASPGYPQYFHQFAFPCLWEIVALPNQKIRISIKYLRFPKTFENSFTEDQSRLSILDEDNNYVVNITDSLSNGPLNFTLSTGKLLIQFIVPEHLKKKEEVGVYMIYESISNSCPTPQAPRNGEVAAHDANLRSKVIYRCHPGFVLVGESQAECLWKGQWNHPPPSCETISVLPSFVAATNDSESVTAPLPPATEASKISKNGKKKASESLNSKNVSEIKPAKEGSLDMSGKNTGGTITSQITNSKNIFVPKNETDESHLEADKVISESPRKEDAGNGPKSEPHLLPVIPPNHSRAKSTPSSFEPTSPSAVAGNPIPEEPKELMPTQGSGFFNIIDFTGLRLSFTMLYIVLGVGIPLIAIFIITIVIIVYRRKYPVRMRFGRKFSTFENPLYVSKDAHHPRELKRLTNENAR